MATKKDSAQAAVVEEPRGAEAVGMAPGLEAVEFDHLEIPFEIPAPEPKTRYWIGIVKHPECPFQGISVHGVDFPQFTETPQDSQDGGSTSYMREWGRIAELTDRQVEELKSRLTRRVVRVLGPGAARQIDVDRGKYTRHPGDKPLARYLYMVRIGDRMPSDWRNTPPPVMARP